MAGNQFDRDGKHISGCSSPYPWDSQGLCPFTKDPSPKFQGNKRECPSQFHKKLKFWLAEWAWSGMQIMLSLFPRIFGRENSGSLFLNKNRSHWQGVLNLNPIVFSLSRSGNHWLWYPMNHKAMTGNHVIGKKAPELFQCKNHKQQSKISDLACLLILFSACIQRSDRHGTLVFYLAVPWRSQQKGSHRGRGSTTYLKTWSMGWKPPS